MDALAHLPRERCSLAAVAGQLAVDKPVDGASAAFRGEDEFIILRADRVDRAVLWRGDGQGLFSLPVTASGEEALQFEQSPENRTTL